MYVCVRVRHLAYMCLLSEISPDGVFLEFQQINALIGIMA